MFVGQLSLADNVCVSVCAADKIKHWFEVMEYVLVVVLVQVMRFNREQAAPDVSQEEYSHTYSITSLPTETGFRYIHFVPQTMPIVLYFHDMLCKSAGKFYVSLSCLSSRVASPNCNLFSSTKLNKQRDITNVGFGLSSQTLKNF